MRNGGIFGRLPRVEVQDKVGGRYTLLDELGSGGMAVVWHARDEVLGRSVAVKLLAGRYADDPQWRARIRDEARAAAQLSPHPHIAQVYDFGDSESDGTSLPYVVMELVNGPTLQERVADGPLPPQTVFRICGEVASALQAAHADGLVHRDIKPANVIVTPAGAKVVDFGIAATAGPGEPEDVVLGTPAYLAPERLTGGPVQPATDMYALGILLYRLLANESPWTVESTTQMLNAHVYVEPAPLPALPGIPAAVIDLVHRSLRKDPADRPPAAEAAAVLADAADAEIREEPVRSVPVQRRAESIVSPVGNSAAVKAPPASGAAERGTSGGKRPMVIALVVLLVLAAAGLVWALLPSSKPGGQAGQAAPTTASHDPSASASRPAGPTTSGTATAGGTATGAAPVAGATVRTTLPTPANPGAARAAGPGGTAARPTTRAPASSAPAPRTRTLSSSAGTVTATCSSGKAHLTSWTAKSPYHVQSVNAGPALTTAVVFANGISRTRMTVTCVAGTPTAVVLPL